MKAKLVTVTIRVIVQDDVTNDELKKAFVNEITASNNKISIIKCESKNDTKHPYDLNIDGGYGGDWVFERSSGYAGYRCKTCGEWKCADELPRTCRCL